MSEQRQPRVLHIGKYLPPVPGGMETYLFDLLNTLSRTHLKVAALAYRKRRMFLDEAGLNTNVELFTTLALGEISFIPVAPAFPIALRRALREFKPDLLHFHLPNPAVFTALFLPEARKLPWVIHWHADVDAVLTKNRVPLVESVYRRLEAKMLSFAKVVIGTSDSYISASRTLSRYRSKCVAIPLGIDLGRMFGTDERSRARATTLWTNGDMKRVLAVGRLTYYKGFDLVLQAIAQAPDCSLIIVGEGLLRTRLERLAADLSISNRVRFLGRVSQRSLSALYEVCDVFCLASTDRSEAFGLVLLEAAYHGAPIIATNISGSAVAEIAQGFGGKIIPCNDVNALALALKLVKTRVQTPEAAKNTVGIKADTFINLYSDILHASRFE